MWGKGEVTERGQETERNHERSTGKSITHTRNGEVRASKGGIGAGTDVPATQKRGVTYQVNSYVTTINRSFLMERWGEERVPEPKPTPVAMGTI